MLRIEPYFPLSHAIPCVDDRQIISEITFVIQGGLRRRDAPTEYGPPKTTYNRFIRWSRMGGDGQGSNGPQDRWKAIEAVFNKIFAGLVAKAGEPDQLVIDATHLKAHRTVASLLQNGLFPDV